MKNIISTKLFDSELFTSLDSRFKLTQLLNPVLEKCRPVFTGVHLAVGYECWHRIYLGFSILLILFLGIGLDKSGGEVHFFGITLFGNSVTSVYFTAVMGLWFVGTVILSFVALKPLSRLMRPNFLNFTRFSMGDCSLMEQIRLVILIRAIFIIVLPFCFACIVSLFMDDFVKNQSAQLFTSTVPAVIYIGILIYMASLLRVPEDSLGLIGLTPLLAFGLHRCAVAVGSAKVDEFCVWLPQIPLMFFNPEMECLSLVCSNQYQTFIFTLAFGFISFRFLRTAKTLKLDLLTKEQGKYESNY